MLYAEIGFHGNNVEEKYRVDMVGESIYDMSRTMMMANFEKDEAKKVIPPDVITRTTKIFPSYNHYHYHTYNQLMPNN